MSLPPEDERTVMPFSRAAPAPGSDEGGNNALPKGTRLGEFEITGLLGEGGFGIVYLAYDSSLERNVALKEYMPSSLASRSTGARVSVKSERNADTFQAGLRSFVNEARMLAQFDDPSLLKVYRFWEANGTAYMVMPYYQGPTLKQALLARPAAPDEAWLKGLLAPLLDALGLIHQQQCYHRDIAPDNILMLDDGRPLLLDFGAARRAIGGMTQAFTVILKQGYAPIEQYAEMPGMDQGAWTDLYALASVVHFAIEGHPPPPAVARIITDPYVPLAARFGGRYSAEFLAAIDSALAVKPEQRPQSVAEMRSLLRLGDSAVARAAPARPPALPDKPAAAPAQAARKGKPYLAYSGIAAFVLAATAGGYALIGGDAPPAPARNSGVRSVGPDPGFRAPPRAEPQAPPAPAAEAPFDAIGALHQVLDGASRERAVSIGLAKARVQIGKDRLQFTVHSSHPGYLYVLMVGTDRSNFWMLFPNAVDQNNRIASGQTLKLPRKGWMMGADGPAGIDQFVAIVADSPRNFRAAGLVDGQLFAEFPVARAAQLQRAHGGATALYAGVPECGADAGCSPAYGAAVFSIEEFGR
jgi:hypothetical protein